MGLLVRISFNSGGFVLYNILVIMQTRRWWSSLRVNDLVVEKFTVKLLNDFDNWA